MGTKTPDGAKRLDGLAWNPDNLFIVGVDARADGTIDGPEHPRWDPRALLPVDEELVQSLMRWGRNFQSVVYVDVGGIAEVEDGRQRVKAAREANRRFEADGSDRRVLVHTAMAVRGLDALSSALLGHELNAMRVDDDDMTRCEKVAHAMRFADGGATSKSAVAKANRWHPSRVDKALLIVERASPVVKDALRAGRIKLDLAAELAAKPTGEQAAWVDEIAKLSPEGKATLSTVKTRCPVCDGAQGLEGYMVHDAVWLAAGMEPDDRAHLACLEQQIGRTLAPEDFTDAPINWWVHFVADRLAGKKEPHPGLRKSKTK